MNGACHADRSEETFVETALFNSGRPVVVVPCIQTNDWICA